MESRVHKTPQEITVWIIKVNIWNKLAKLTRTIKLLFTTLPKKGAKEFVIGLRASLHKSKWLTTHWRCNSLNTSMSFVYDNISKWSTVSDTYSAIEEVKFGVARSAGWTLFNQTKHEKLLTTSWSIKYFKNETFVKRIFASLKHLQITFSAKNRVCLVLFKYMYVP